jgi:hypothetical protein
MQSYFFIAVSTRENFEICRKHAYAGFPNTINGLWAFVDINVGDFVTFLYGARAYDLYKVVKKEAILDAENLPPWKNIHFRKYNKVYYFPYRLHLKPIRRFDEPLARAEFLYIAENLMRRGGYEKTHFQADQTTLHSVSTLGRITDTQPEPLHLPPYQTYTPRFIRGKTSSNTVAQLRETILQALIRQHLSKPEVLKDFLKALGLEHLSTSSFEALGERALEEGHVDILLKEPEGRVNQIIIEVKLGTAQKEHVEQLQKYMDVLGSECAAGVLIAERIPRGLPREGIRFARYSFDVDVRKPHAFEEMLSALRISVSPRLV